MSLNTHRKVQIVNGRDSGLKNVTLNGPVVMVDDKLLYGVTRIKIDHTYDQGRCTAEITLTGVDVDLEAAPDYLVRVVGPKPPKEDGRTT